MKKMVCLPIDFKILLTGFNQSYNCQASHYLGRNRLPKPSLILPSLVLIKAFETSQECPLNDKMGTWRTLNKTNNYHSKIFTMPNLKLHNQICLILSARGHHDELFKFGRRSNKHPFRLRGFRFPLKKGFFRAIFKNNREMTAFKINGDCCPSFQSFLVRFLIARLARSDPRNSFLCRPCIFLFVLAFCAIYSNLIEFHHLLVLDKFRHV